MNLCIRWTGVELGWNALWRTGTKGMWITSCSWKLRNWINKCDFILTCIPKAQCTSFMILLGKELKGLKCCIPCFLSQCWVTRLTSDRNTEIMLGFNSIIHLPNYNPISEKIQLHLSPPLSSLGRKCVAVVERRPLVEVDCTRYNSNKIQKLNSNDQNQIDFTTNANFILLY